MKNLFKNKKFRYGSLGIGYTVAVIALLVAVNLIVSSLVFSNAWYFDMTGEKVYNISETTKEYIDSIDTGYNDITIYFFAPEDKMSLVATSSNYYSQSGMWGMKYVHSLARELAEDYDFIKCDYIDVEKEPDKIKQIVGEEYYDAIKLTENHIIVDNYTVERESDGKIINGTDGKPLYWHNYRVYDRNTFYSFDYASSAMNVTAFKGDYRFCSAIMSVCNERIPTAYFISGHGEDIGSYTVGKQNTVYGYAQYLYQLFRDSGYKVKKIDLQHEDFGNEENSVAVIYSPHTDYSSSSETESHNELGKISAFLEKGNNSLMVFLDYQAQTLPGLESYVEKNFGVKYEDAQIKDNGDNSIDVNMLHLVGSPQTDKASTGYKISSAIADSKQKLIFPGCRPLTLSDSSKASAVVLAPASSKAVYIDKTVSYGETEPACLATLSRTESGAYVFCAGTSAFTDVIFSDSAIYENRNLLLSTIDLMSEVKTPVNVGYKIIASEGLDITKAQATSSMIVFCAVIPAAVAIIGAIVYIRRRHS